jgi:hypothetical protein
MQIRPWSVVLFAVVIYGVTMITFLILNACSILQRYPQ